MWDGHMNGWGWWVMVPTMLLVSALAIGVVVLVARTALSSSRDERTERDR